MDKKIEVIVRMVILREDKILLCKQKTESYYFLPGGHVELGENVATAIERELKEEINITPENYRFIGAVENIFSDNKSVHHEINLVFEVELEEKEIEAMEDHLEFNWKDTDSLNKEKILPIALRENLVKWLEDKKIFWGSQC